MNTREKYNRLSVEQFGHSGTHELRYTDVDVRHHVNNVSIAEMFSEGRYRFISHIFQSIERPPSLNFFVGTVALSYLRETEFALQCEVGTTILDTSPSSIHLAQALFQEERVTSVAEAVLVATHDHRSTGLPASLRDRLVRHSLTDDTFPRLLR